MGTFLFGWAACCRPGDLPLNKASGGGTEGGRAFLPLNKASGGGGAEGGRAFSGGAEAGRAFGCGTVGGRAFCGGAEGGRAGERNGRTCS